MESNICNLLLVSRPLRAALTARYPLIPEGKSMLSCIRCTELLTQSLEHSLTLRERLVLRIHLMMCRGCRNHAQHLRMLRKASRSYVRSP